MKMAQKTSGFTLLEVMVSVSIIAIVVGVLVGMSIGLGDTARVRDIKGASADEARRAMIFLTRDLRQASVASLSGAPGDSISFRMAADVSGNGTAVNVGGNLELGPVITVGRDVNDLNNDGLTDSQLIWSDGVNHRVLANNLLPNENPDAAGNWDPAVDDANRGVWFNRNGSLVEVIIQTGGQDRRGRQINFNLREVVRPRN